MSRAPHRVLILGQGESRAALPLQISCSSFWSCFVLKQILLVGLRCLSATLHRILGPERQVGEDLLLVEEESLEQGGLRDVDDLEGDKIAEAEVDAVIQLPGG